MILGAYWLFGVGVSALVGWDALIVYLAVTVPVLSFGVYKELTR